MSSEHILVLSLQQPWRHQKLESGKKWNHHRVMQIQGKHSPSQFGGFTISFSGTASICLVRIKPLLNSHHHQHQACQEAGQHPRPALALFARHQKQRLLCVFFVSDLCSHDLSVPWLGSPQNTQGPTAGHDQTVLQDESVTH